MVKVIKMYIVSLLLLIDRITIKRMGCITIPGSTYNLIKICYIQYKGKKLEFEDGTIVNKGDLIGEMHLSNIAISCGKIGDTIITSELQLLGIIRNELKLLAQVLLHHQMSPRVSTYYSTSLLGAGAKRLGFRIIEIPQTLEIKRMALWMSLLRKYFAPSFANQTKKHRKHKTVSEIWITELKLMTL